MRLSKKYTAYSAKHPSRNINQGEAVSKLQPGLYLNLFFNIHHSLFAKGKGHTPFSQQNSNPQAYLLFTTTIIFCLQRFKTQA